MTASPELSPVPTTVTPVTALDGTRLRAGIARLRAALRDGTLHHHRYDEIPVPRRSYAVDVVRVWADGGDLEAQRRRCGVCSPAPVFPLTPRPRARS
ncbi:hypothetical protein [Actinomycetospora sp. NBRC 106375]|uniref:hypothetical protein n=1 Tax=Actinomycetospora sp. NBRC 106375 TaxID=3032207 RepID=UPI002552106D|nr:hypothetical protein [Actinomycetospora sp. NBRC 106375]